MDYGFAYGRQDMFADHCGKHVVPGDIESVAKFRMGGHAG